jgi:RNA polymerase sigma-70 factor (ECF subfamily)
VDLTDRPSDGVWLAGLRASGPARDAAIARLHHLLVRAARAEATRRGAGGPVSGPELEDIAAQAADDALLAILGKLDQFRGDSRFTTWAYKFVILEVASKLTRHAWRRMPPREPLPGSDPLVERFSFTPAEILESRELLAALRDAIEHDLTKRQRRVFIAIVFEGVPLDVLAAELGSNRNAIYKTMFDARSKLRARLVANGHMHDPAAGR